MINIKTHANNFIEYLFSINPYELTLLADILGVLIAMSLSSNQQNVVGNFLELIGQQILTIQAQNANLSPDQTSSIEINKLLEHLNFKFEYIEDLIVYLKKTISTTNS